jgi:hypothetical protein
MDKSRKLEKVCFDILSALRVHLTDCVSVLRTVWLLYTLDTLASLETGAVIQITTRDIRHIPLPYANSIWMAPSAEQWCKLTMEHEAAGVTLDDAMYCICHLIMPNQESRLFSTVVGPYGRHVLILTVLRGLIEYGQGKPRGGYVTRRWILSRPADPKPRSADEIHNHIIFGYRMILDHVRTPLFLVFVPGFHPLDASD